MFDGRRESLTRQDIVENVSLYWLTNSVISAARLYWESKYSVIAAKGVTLPVAKGGHFAAWDQPQILAEELRAGFRQLR